MNETLGQQLENALPPHKASLHLTHNDHKAVYESAVEFLADMEADDFIAPDERERCIAADSIWELQWYPDTPVGFCRLISASLTDLLTAIEQRGIVSAK